MFSLFEKRDLRMEFKKGQLKPDEAMEYFTAEFDKHVNLLRHDFEPRDPNSMIKFGHILVMMFESFLEVNGYRLTHTKDGIEESVNAISHE